MDVSSAVVALLRWMSIDYPNTAAPINSLRGERMPLDQWARFI